MRTGKFLLTIAVILVIILGILAILPGTDAMFYSIGRFFSFIAKLLVVIFLFLIKLVIAVLILVILLGGPWILGALGKTVGVPFIDSKLDEDVNLNQFQRIVLGLVTALLAGALGIGVTMLILIPMGGFNWLYNLITWLGWSGVWEVPPTFMGFYWFIGYIWAWGVAPHEQDNRRR